MIDAIRLVLLIALALSGLITFLLMTSALEENGNKSILFLRYIGTLVDFKYMTDNTVDGKKKSYYRRLRWFFLLSIALFIGTVLTFLVVPWRQ